MLCWASAIVAQLSLALILYDAVKGNWQDLPAHAMLGIAMTVFFYISCSLLGETLSLGVLVLPAIFLLVQWMKYLGNARQPPSTTPLVQQCLRATPAPSCPPADSVACPPATHSVACPPAAHSVACLEDSCT